MLEQHQVYFGPFRLDPGNEQLWRGPQTITLKPKTFTVLRYLLMHAGRLVTKEEMLDALWPDVHVTDGVLKVCVLELRRALGDDPQAPRFIQTVHRRGYRFIAKVQSSQLKVQSSKSQPALSPQSLIPAFVGREAELAQLHQWLEKALRGERQIVFVTGEAGIGKTTVLEAFVASVSAKGELWIGRGQCIEHYGSGEAYMPVLEAVGRLCREPDGEHLIALLHQHAPTWLVQMPALLNGADLEALQRKTQGATRERMLRETTEAVEVLTAERALILWLEDLQWSDVSTLEWISTLARRPERARLLLIGTYRPVDVIINEHPLKGVKQELQLHGHCEELPLGFLTEEQVAKYLTVRVPIEASGRSPLHRLARTIHQRTDGNPLFMVNMVDYLIAQGVISQGAGRWVWRDELAAVEAGVPARLQQLIEQHIERLSPEDQRMLEAASVVGAEFSAAAVAASFGTETGEIEEQCERLTRRRHFLKANGISEWPDGTAAARYRFLHALYQSVLYERIPAGRRQRLHRQIGEREEQAYGERAREIAAELAVHFERGRDYRRAIQYLQQAGENATRRSAHQEAINLLTRGLELLKTLPDTPERAQQELYLLMALGPVLIATKGQAAPDVEHTYVRARALCQKGDDTPQLFQVLHGLWLLYNVRAELQRARELGEQLLMLTQRQNDPALLVEAHRARGVTLALLGELSPALTSLEQGIAHYDLQQHGALAFRYGQDPGVISRVIAALALWWQGYPDQALRWSHEALALAQDLSHPFTLASALCFTARLHQLRRELRTTQERAEAAIALSSEQGFPYWVADGTILRGWALAAQGQREEGMAQMRRGMAATRATGAAVWQPYFLALLVEAYKGLDQAEEGLAVLVEALATVNKTGERVSEAELYRLKGELTLQQFKVQGSKFKVTNPQSLTPNPQAEAEAEACFHKAIEIARRQQAKSLELRAVMSLSQLWQRQSKKKQARKMLADIYGWFTEGFDTVDLKEAKALLESLGC